MGSLELICWNQNRDDNRWAPANEIVVCALAPQLMPRTRQFLKAEEFQRNSVILTEKYNKEYRLHVARQFCMLWKTLLLCIFLCARARARVCVCVCVWETKRRRNVRLHTRVYGTSNAATLRIQMSHNIQKWNTAHSIQINWKIKW